MRWYSVAGIVLLSKVAGADESALVSLCNKNLPSWAYNRSACNAKPSQYTYNMPLIQVLGGQTSMNYDVKQSTTTETVSMGAKYSYDLFLAQIQSSYVQGRFDNAPSTGNTNLLVRYNKKLWDSLALSASENVYIPSKNTNNLSDPMKYTSLLKALYPVNDLYNVFAEGSYSLLQTPAAENISYRNPYSYTTGITYIDGTDTSINASYILRQDFDPTLPPEKKIKIAHKHKLNKKLKASFSVTKSLEAEQPDNKALFDLIYAY